MFAVGEHCMIVFTHIVIIVIQKNQTKGLEKERGCGGVNYLIHYNHTSIY